MMRNRTNKIKRKMNAIRRKRKYPSQKQPIFQRGRNREMMPISISHEDEREEPIYTWNSSKQYSQHKQEPFFRKDRFLMQVLGSICLFFIIAIILQSSSSKFQNARGYVEKLFEEEFKFNVVANWYEDAFGRPLALFPTDMDVVAPEDFQHDENIYALPANGIIRETFAENGRGIYVETDSEEQVSAVKGGMVRFVGEDEEQEWGKIVVVRHYDGGESWYGMLENIKVELYDHVETGEVLGEVSPHEEKDSIGYYYFALKEGDTFIDPNEVIPFD